MVEENLMDSQIRNLQEKGFYLVVDDYGTGHSKITLINKIIGTVLNIALMTFMIKQYGAMGAAWSMVLGFLVFAFGNVTLLFIIRKKIFDNNGVKNT